jgi:cysteine desulfurase
VQKDGRISLDELKAAITDKTILITIMAANNEIGVIQPIVEIGTIAKEKGILFHTDAVQMVGKVPFNVNDLKVDMASLSAHKMYGPKGVGALYVRRRNPRVLLSAIIDGGGHERGMRSGTLNVTGIVGFGKAAELCKQEMAAESERLRNLRDYLNDKLHKQLDEIYINGSMEHRLPHNLNISFAYVEGESLLMGINDVAVSSGSACTSASLEPSYVLKALGRGRRPGALVDPLRPRPVVDERGSRLRRRQADVGRHKLRDMSPLYELAKEGVDLSTMVWQTEGH